MGFRGSPRRRPWTRLQEALKSGTSGHHDGHMWQTQWLVAKGPFTSLGDVLGFSFRSGCLENYPSGWC